MSSLIRWEPFSDLVSLRDAMDRLFEDSFVRSPTRLPLPWRSRGLAIDMFETKDNLVVKATVPGVKPEDLEISITGDTLTIKGETKVEEDVEEGNYIYRERRYGAVSRQVSLPAGLNTEEAEANFENGELTLRIPKSEEKKPRTIKVTTSATE